MPLTTTATQLKDTDTQGNVIVLYDYRYDAGGDIIEEQMNPAPDVLALASADMAYTNYNRLSDINGFNPSFDKDGNMTQGLLAGENSNFSFDSRNRLSQTQNSTGSSQYQYDAENQRIALSHNGQTTRFVINSQPNLSQMLLKTDPDGTQTYYVYGLGLIGDESQGNYRHYHPDYRGSTVALSDEAGQVTQRFTYSPYGTLVKGDARQTPFLFNGLYGVMTDVNGLYYMRARYYNAEIRRFVNQDLLLGYIQDGGTLNRFAYVTGNPVKFLDPFGLAEYCGQCASTDCLLYGGNLCTEQPSDNDIVRPFFGGSETIKGHFFIVGASQTLAKIYDTAQSKTYCFESYCSSFGPGMYVGASAGIPFGLSNGNIENALTGYSVGLVADVGTGFGATGSDLSCGINNEGLTSIGSSKSPVRAGFGGGFLIGIEVCRTSLVKCPF